MMNCRLVSYGTLKLNKVAQALWLMEVLRLKPGISGTMVHQMES